MLIIKGNRLYEETASGLQEQLSLEDCEVQDTFDFAEDNPELLDKLRHLNELQCQTQWEAIATHIAVE